MKCNFYAYINLSLAMIIVGSSVVFGKIITNAFPVFLASGLRFASAIEAGIITSTSPGMMVIVTYLLFNERPGKVHIISVCLVVMGIISVNGLFRLAGIATDISHLFGNALMIGAVVGEAFFLLMRKRISSKISNIALTGYLCFLGFIMFLPLSIYQGISFDFSSVSNTAWLSILYFGAVFTVLAYLFWFQGVSQVSGSTAGIFTAVMPVSAVVLPSVFLNETFAMHHACGHGLILIAMILLSLKGNKVRKPIIS